MTKANELIGTREVAKILGKSERTIRRWRRQGALLPKPFIDRRNSPRWKRGDIVQSKKA